MKWLESAPERYDRGMRMLSCGRIDDIYQRIAARVAAPGRHILDLGCGTGGVALACATGGAHVVGIDTNAGMLEIARRKPVPGPGGVEWIELGMAETEDRFAPASFDAVVACLVFSELSTDEQAYALRASYSLLVRGGQIVIADETLPRDVARRVWWQLCRWPRHALTYLLTQASTRPVRGLAAALRAAGFAEVEETRLWSDTFAILLGRKPRATA